MITNPGDMAVRLESIRLEPLNARFSLGTQLLGAVIPPQSTLTVPIQFDSSGAAGSYHARILIEQTHPFATTLEIPTFASIVNDGNFNYEDRFLIPLVECQEAADAPALRPPDLEADAPSIPQLRFERHPACRLLSSRWPVDRLRAFALSGGSEPPPAIGGEPVRLLVRRSPDGVSLRRLPESEFALLSGLFAGVRLEEALEGLGRDPAPLLAAALRDGLFARLLPKS